LAGRRILVTGDTGFKGGWLATWLTELGAEVTGLARDIPTEPALFDQLGLRRRLRHVAADVRDAEAVARVLREARPELVLHLAAQSLVGPSYRDPVGTWSTNVVGTATVLQEVRRADRPCAVVVVTSDKCYRNEEWPWPYREIDPLGGADPYSASKAATELVAQSFCRSFFPGSPETTGDTGDGDTRSRTDGPPVQVVTARAGNVLGGGDWATGRIVPDCIRAWQRDEPVLLRSPGSVRPWQHVLESLSGYLVLGSELLAAVDDGRVSDVHAEAVNFGPAPGRELSVLDVVTGVATAFGHPDPERSFRGSDSPSFAEAHQLRLDSTKALLRLGWHGVLEAVEMMELTGTWYRRYVESSGTVGAAEELLRLTAEQIHRYTALAAERGLDWAQQEECAAQQSASPSASAISGSQPGSRSPVFHGTMTSRSR
jgi:CDP-glucose 4,6-dehydratase